jgi:hypothetical protein
MYKRQIEKKIQTRTCTLNLDFGVMLSLLAKGPSVALTCLGMEVVSTKTSAKAIGY